MNLFSEIGRLSRYGVRLATRPRDVNLGGFLLRLPAGAGGRVRASIYAEKYEVLETRALPRVLRPGDVVVEAGAAIGYVGLHCARIVGVENLVLIEANKDLLPEIENNFRRNGLDTPEILTGVAAAEAGGLVDFHVSEQFWSSSVIDRGNTTRTDRLPMIGLNALFRERKANVFICDIEGGEFSLLPALDFSTIRLAIIELHAHIGGAGAVEDAIAVMARHGLPLAHTIADDVFVFERPQG